MPGHILLIENDTALVASVSRTLEQGGYRVTTASSSRTAFAQLFKSPPDAIVLDVNLPDLDAFHIARELKRNMMLRHIPVIVLCNRLDFLEKMRTLDVIVDEYVVLPLNANELLLRTQLVLERATANLDANPLTRLPGNISIVKALKAKLGSRKPYAVGYADLNNFKAFNDKYGFSHGDHVIRLIAQAIVKVVQKLSPTDCFVGHVGGDDFLFICEYDKAEEICRQIIEEFDREAPRFYSEEDRTKGFIVVEDRRGVVSQFPIVSVAIGLVSDEGKKFSNLGQINHSLTQLKKYAKSFHGSAYVRDRRNLNALTEFTWGAGSAAGSSDVLGKIATDLGAYLPGRLAELLRAQAISIVFQPILDMKTDEVVGHEAFARGPAGSALESATALFQTARTAGRMPDLDVMCMEKARVASNEFNRGVHLFLNVFPETLLQDKMLVDNVLSKLSPHSLPVVLELTGANRANDLGYLLEAMGKLRKWPVKLCVDVEIITSEHGTRMVSDLKPDFIKIAMPPFKGMTDDIHKQQRFIQTVAYIQQVGAQVICAELESRADSYFAVKAGVRLGQGFLFAAPSPVARRAPR